MTERIMIFRTWDKNNLRMHHVPSNNVEFRAWWKEHCSENEREDEIIIMQFSGFYDRRHNEIFEGDIINYNFNSETHNKAVVHYIQEYLCFGVGEKTSLSDIYNIEVIGNIFENPEEAPDECYQIGHRASDMFGAIPGR